MATFAERFWAKVQKGNGCWLWTAARSSNGYGKVYRNPTLIPAHRAAWELAFGPIPTGMYVCHRCDTPLCVRADHLFLGTNRENALDASRKGRLASGDRNGSRTHPERLVRGTANHQARLSESDVRQIRTLCATTPQRVIAAHFGTTQANVSMIVRRERWAHL